MLSQYEISIAYCSTGWYWSLRQENAEGIYKVVEDAEQCYTTAAMCAEAAEQAINERMVAGLTPN